VTLTAKEFIDMLGRFPAFTSPAIAIPKVMRPCAEQLERQAIHSQELIDPLRTYLAHLVALITPGDLQFAFLTNFRHGIHRRAA